MSESLIESELFGVERGASTNAAANRAGLFEAAHGGTLLLDDVGDISAALQMSLLRVLETGEVRRIGSTRPRKVDVRIISASHRDLGELVRQEKFRADQRYRLEVVKITVPPLRDRLDDLLPLAEALLEAVQQKYGLPKRHISAAAIEALKNRLWIGNVGELRHVLANATLMALGDEILPCDVLAREDVSVGARNTLTTTRRKPSRGCHRKNSSKHFNRHSQNLKGIG